MEIKTYSRFFLRKWKTIILIFGATLIATAIFTFRAAPVYQAKSSYIVRLSAVSVDDKTTISALDTLSNRVEIAATYAKVTSSHLIRDMAAKELGLSASQSSKLVVSSQILAGTNVLEITVEGNDPNIVRDYANMLGQQSILYVNNLYEIYALEILDEAQLPNKPIKPNIPNNLLLGGVFGLVLGFAFSLLLEYLSAPLESQVSFNILDEKIGTYNERYFKLRLHQEINRAKRNEGVLSVVLIDIDHRRLLDTGSAQSRINALRSVASMFSKSIRDEDVMATFAGSEIALLLPELDGKTTKGVVERLLESVSMISVELGIGDERTSLHGAAGVAPFISEDTASVDDLMMRAKNALDSMRESTYGRVMISTEGSVKVLKNNKEKS